MWGGVSVCDVVVIILQDQGCKHVNNHRLEITRHWCLSLYGAGARHCSEFLKCINALLKIILRYRYYYFLMLQMRKSRPSC